MLIEKVDVRSFRTLRSVSLEFGRGLNVIHGDNDVGKSTLVDAIRTCLTMRARGTGLKYTSLRPRDGGDPEVRVVFRHDDTTYDVHKRFGPRGTTHLNVRRDGAVASDYSGDEADHQLRAVLGLSEVARGRSVDLGLLPLLCVEQGSSRDQPDLAGNAGLVLAERLRSLSGEVIAGGHGEKIFAAVEASFNETFTSRGPRLGSAMQLAQQAHERSQSELAALLTRRSALATTASHFDDVTVRLRSVSSSIPALVTGVVDAEREANAVRDGHAKLARAQADVDVAAVHVRVAADRHGRRVEDRSRVDAARMKVESARAELGVAQEHLARHEVGRGEVEDALRMTVSLETRLRSELNDRQRVAVSLDAARALRDLDTKIELAQTHERDLLDAKRRAASEVIDDTRLREIERLARVAEVAVAALAASGTTITLRSKVDAHVAIDGARVEIAPGVDAERTVCTRTILDVGEVQIEVTPHGAELESVQSAAARAVDAFKACLASVHAADVSEVRTRAAERSKALQDAHVAQQLLTVAAPAGIAALEATRTDLAARVAGEIVESVSDRALEDARQAVTGTLAALDDAGRAATRARDAHLVFEQRSQQLNANIRVANEALSGAGAALERAEADVAASTVSIGGDDALTSAHATTVAELRACEATRDQIKATLPAATIAETDERVRRAQRALKCAKDEEARLSQDSYRLEVDLQAPDLIGLDDRIAAATAAVEGTRTSLAEATERAEAVKLLYELLRDERAAARRRFLAPLAREVQKLLGILYPGSRIELDEQFAITRIERVADGAHEFDALGGGSQEQLGIVVRLAMARVLGAGGPMPVILDDAIVFTSETRFARMADVLLSTAGDLQLLVFTCHWPRYRELGPDVIVDLEAAKSGGSAVETVAA